MLKKNILKRISLMAICSIAAFSIGFRANALDQEAVGIWGPVDRPTYTLAHPATEPVFNSITDNHNTDVTVGDGVSQLDETIDYISQGQVNNTESNVVGLGDERNFVRIREAGTDDFYDDIVEAVPGKEYEVYVYFHNNATPHTELYAYNTRLKMEAPERLKAGEIAAIKGIISWHKQRAETAEELAALEVSKVWDSTFLKATEDMDLRYVPNSAVIHNGNNDADTANGLILNNTDLWNDNGRGAMLAYSVAVISDPDDEEETTAKGIIPPCNEYAGYVTFRLKADQAKFYIEKEVSEDGSTNWKDTIEAEPGDTLHFRIHYKNTGTTEQKNINVSDNLPTAMTYSKVKNPQSEDKDFQIRWVSKMIDSDTVTVNENRFVDAEKFFNGDGEEIGDYEAGAEFYVYYDVKLADADAFDKCVTNIWNRAQVATRNGTEFDQVKVTVRKNCETPKEPKFEFDKMVSLDGKTDWKEAVEAAPGDTLHFRIHYSNTGEVLQENVKANDILPAQMIYEALKNAADENSDFEVRFVKFAMGATQPSIDKKVKIGAKSFFGEDGFVVGNFEPNTEFYIYYDVKLAAAKDFKECEMDIWNKAQLTTSDGEKNDKVKVTVKKDCTIPDELPKTGSHVTVIILSVFLGCAACGYVACAIKGFSKNKD